MTEPDTPTVTLATNQAMLPVAVQFVEAVATAFGQSERGRLKLRLATEEIFSHLCHGASGVDTVEIACADRAYCTRVVYRLRGPHLDLRGLNIASVRTHHPGRTAERPGARDRSPFGRSPQHRRGTRRERQSRRGEGQGVPAFAPRGSGVAVAQGRRDHRSARRDAAEGARRAHGAGPSGDEHSGLLRLSGQSGGTWSPAASTTP